MTPSCASSCTAPDSNDTPADLVEFDGLEQCLEIAFAETLVALALDDFEEDGPDHVGGEDLQQDALFVGAVSVDEYPALLQLGDIFAMARDAFFDAFVIRLRRVLERDSAAAQHVHRAIDVVGRERDVLDALALVLAQVFLDLRLVVLRFVYRDADLVAGAGERPREQARLLAFDVEVADLAEVEQLLV